MSPHAAKLTLLLMPLAAGCAPPGSGDSTPGLFRDATDELGLERRIPDADAGAHFMPEVMAGGCALFDFDSDGDLDVYVVGARAGAAGGYTSPAGGNRLYRQDAGPRFVDVTAESGAGHTGYGMGVAAGDYDNDGHVDLFVTNYGPDCLLRNQGDGTFRDVTHEAGIESDGWGMSAGFFDYDGDGLLDLFVTRYVDIDSVEPDKDAGGRPEYPAPARYAGLADKLYVGVGQGRFRDASEQLADKPGRGLGLLLSDLDGDGLLDMYVANDGEPNFAWVQGPAGSFQEQAAFLGLSVNLFGQTGASMGVDRGDVGAGTLDVFVAHLDTETHTLYRERSPGRFRDVTAASGLGLAGEGFTGFGTSFGDFDLDGDLDLVVVNGHVLHKGSAATTDRLTAHWAPYAQPNQFFENDGTGRFTDASERAGAFAADVEVGRGLALGDVDGDGDLDALVRNGNGTIALYLAQAPPADWLVVRALDPATKRDAYGARVQVVGERGTLVREITPVRSYLASSDPRAHFGLAGIGTVRSIQVHWPSGSTETYDGGPTNGVRVLVRGEGSGSQR